MNAMSKYFIKSVQKDSNNIIKYSSGNKKSKNIRAKLSKFSLEKRIHMSPCYITSECEIKLGF